MAKDDIFNIEWEGLQEFRDALDSMEKEADKIIMEEMTTFGQLAEEGAKALVHHDEGTLEDSINFDKAKKVNGQITVEGGSNMIYALRRHEEPPRLGVHPRGLDKSYYVDGQGRGTRGKPSWRGHQPGRKYMENAIKAIEPDYDKMNDHALKRILETES